MPEKRILTAKDIRGLVELFRNSPDISPEKFAGMEFVASACEQFERMSEGDIEQMVKRYFKQ